MRARRPQSLDLGDHDLVIDGLRVFVVIVVVRCGRVVDVELGFEVGQEGLARILRHVDGGRQAIVRDVDELVIALELLGDRLDKRVAVVGLDDPLADLLDDHEELLGVHLFLARQHEIGEDVVVALVKFVEIHARSRRLRPSGRTGPLRSVYSGVSTIPAEGPRDSTTDARPTPAVVVLGAASRDVSRDDPRGWRLGGGVTYGALTLANLGLRVGALIGVDEAASTAGELDMLRDAGVDVRLVRLEHGPVFENIETPNGRVQMALSGSDPVDPRQLPIEWRAAGGWFVGGVAEELSDDWADVFPTAALVATGWQGLIREIVPGERVIRRRPTVRALVSRADLVGVSRDDLDPTALLNDLCRLIRPGATLALTHGARGGIAMTATTSGARGMRWWPSLRPDAVIDPTGAGDVFLATLLAARLEPRLLGGRKDLHLDLRLGAAAASLVLERQGLLGVPDRESLRRRVARTSVAR